ncbi:NUDIX hydrolase [Shimia sp. MMG029]|uniref:NUDIX hydrolase n=1 Tax=Shimia sp. MMG029 TaxID=3021978 RepID=UPI0022FEDF64|nr:NUDIX hydrolase [Shimia sp. MMG029]MDA5556300.1 NUDIX hydrolase [Shimia sp. MMG029]
MTEDKAAIRNAATVIVLRDRDTNPRILMGQRGAKAAFMPNKVVFPGGAVDSGDADIALATPISEFCATRLRQDSPQDLTHSLCVAAIRELWEETGLILGQKNVWSARPAPDWESFAATGHIPTAEALQFVFRAITPPGRPRRFDARFFLLDADEIATDLDDFSAACEELSHLQWIPLSEVRAFDLPFITEVVLAEIEARVTDRNPPTSVPFFKNNDEASLFMQLHGREQDR